MPRPFTKLKALDMDEIAAEVIKAFGSGVEVIGGVLNCEEGVNLMS